MRVRVLIAAVVVAALSAAAAGTAAPPEVRSKQAQATRVLAEIDSIDAQLGHTVEAWNGANLRLASVERELKTNTAQLAVARAQYRVAQQRIAERLVAIYVAGEPDMVDVILGASNVGDLIDGLDAISKVTAQDRRIARQASALKARLDAHERRLVRARAVQRATLADLTAKRAQIQSSLATRRRLLSSIRGQIARIQAAERAREARLAAQARARLAREAGPGRRGGEGARSAAARPRRSHARGSGHDDDRGDDDRDDAVHDHRGSRPDPRHPRRAAPCGTPGSGLGRGALPRRALPLGRRHTGRLRLLGARRLGLRPARNRAPALHRSAVPLGVPVPRDQLQAGDLVFFDALDHVGIYIGAGQFIHAPHTGDVVRVSTMSSGSYAASYVGARRI